MTRDPHPDRKPRLCFVGPMVGKNKGRVTTQGERLAELFQSEGYPVIAVSSSKNRYIRLLEILWTIVRLGKNVDIYLVQVFSGPSIVIEDCATLLACVFKRKIILFLRGGAIPAFIKRWPRWVQRVLNRAHVIVAPSEYLSNALHPYGYTCRVIPNVIDISRYPFRLRTNNLRPKILWMRAFNAEVYNPAMAVRVFARLKKAFPDATLVMAGQDGPALREVQKLAQDLIPDGSVSFLGFLDFPEKIRRYSEADIYINTNHIDNMPVSVVEAFAMGLPVVAADVGGLSAIISHEQNGLLVPDDGDEQMAAQIVRLLGDASLAERLSRNGRQFAEACTWDNVHPKFQTIMRELVAEDSTHTP